MIKKIMHIQKRFNKPKTCGKILFMNKWILFKNKKLKSCILEFLNQSIIYFTALDMKLSNHK